MVLFPKRQFISDGWAEGPLSHYRNATSTQKEKEYFMQWVHPLKLHRVALKTPVGYRCTHGLADDVINDDLGVKVSEQQEITKEKNKSLRPYLKSRNWIREMRKFAGNYYEQGEASLLLYFDELEDPNYEYMEQPIHPNAEIIGVEAYNVINYKIIQWDEWGDPSMYTFRLRNAYTKGTRSIRVHASRVMRYCDKELEERETGFPIVAVIYDEIVILSNIVKATGEASFRWGTGHPLILTKNISDDDEIDIIKSAIGTPTRRSWHVLPSEYIEKFELIGQAGQMLNLKALADLVMDQIIIATKIPRPVFYGEAQIANGEVEDKQYYGLLYEKHVDLEPFVRRFFNRDVNIRKILFDTPDYEIDWGIRQTLNKLDAEELEQRKISNAIAMTTFCTINEVRIRAGFSPLVGPEGDVILGVHPLFAPADESNDYKEGDESTNKRSTRGKDLEKDKTIYGSTNRLRSNKKQVRDAIKNLRANYSVDNLCDMIGFSKGTFYKLEEWANG